MTDPGDALLRAILAEPECDDHRLIYADWLEEQDTPASRDRAEFIRAQLDVHKSRCLHACYTTDPYARYCNDSCCQHCNSDRRASLILSKRFREWFPQAEVIYPKMEPWWLDCDKKLVFRRGCVHSISCTCVDWLTHGPAICRQHPVERLLIADKKQEEQSPVAFWHFDDGGWPGEYRVYNIAEMLPGEWFDWCCSTHNYGRCRSHYPTKESAMQALHTGALAWAKAEAKKEVSV